MRNETKVGLLAVISIAVMIWGYKFMLGQNILTTSTVITSEYTNIDLLQPSSAVLINGFQVGVVSDIYLKTEDMKTLVVTMNIDRGISFPKDAIATIVSTGMMGGKAVRLDFEKPCEGNNCIQNGDQLKGRVEGLLMSMIGDPKELNGYIDQVTGGIGVAFDSLSNKISDPNSNSAIAKSARDIQIILANLNKTTTSLNRFLNSSTLQMNGVLKNLESISNNIAAGNDDIKNSLSNMSTFSNQLKEMELNTTLGKVNKVMDGSATSIEKLTGTLESADKAVAELAGLMNKMKSGEGTMGKLMVDDELYTNLESSTRQLKLLLQDFRLNPKRYTRILSKKQIKYEAPVFDPAQDKKENTGGN